MHKQRLYINPQCESKTNPKRDAVMLRAADRVQGASTHPLELINLCNARPGTRPDDHLTHTAQQIHTQSQTAGVDINFYPDWVSSNRIRSITDSIKSIESDAFPTFRGCEPPQRDCPEFLNLTYYAYKGYLVTTCPSTYTVVKLCCRIY